MLALDIDGSGCLGAKKKALDMSGLDLIDHGSHETSPLFLFAASLSLRLGDDARPNPV